jgi:hypothetical protein
MSEAIRDSLLRQSRREPTDNCAIVYRTSGISTDITDCTRADEELRCGKSYLA